MKLFRSNYYMILRINLALSMGILVSKETTLRRTRLYMVEYKSWLKSIDAALHNFHLPGFVVKAMMWYLSPVRAPYLPDLASSV